MFFAGKNVYQLYANDYLILQKHKLLNRNSE